jgi:glycosyltransferase involved in cell wall biosynthesis
MKIGIDARMLGSKQGGIGRYIHEILKALKHESNIQFVIFLRKDNWDFVEETPNIKKVLADIYWYGWREQLCLPKIIKKEKVDLMHFPHWNIPFSYCKPFVVTIHDLLLLHYPTRASSTLGPITYFFKNIAYKIILRHAIKKSRHIITISEFTKNDILKNFNIEAKKITVTHLAPLPPPLNLPLGQGEKTPANLIHYKITKPYVLYVGVAYPHKNLEGLIEAWKIFCAEHGNDYQLVLAGRKNYFYEKILKRTCLSGRQVQDDNIIFTDYVPDEDLPAFYKNASLYVFPSFYEGFGLPALEAMQYGVPVVSSNSTCLPEILKDAVLYFDPSNKPAISDAIWRGLTDEKLRQELNQKSVQLIHNYDWKNTAKITLETYLNVI